ncbi:hypothetical protein EV356DRAFT_517626 [Viridothelium virens]|uniref:F-box domain-containing protein n=1 Tax=Viridothelium virens TaxID=1048519 RepID=A0A6A6H2L8_VIRVR|nr:hypothetical protein EV356DRAFT_517626 [Viridothelium virens]
MPWVDILPSFHDRRFNRTPIDSQRVLRLHSITALAGIVWTSQYWTAMSSKRVLEVPELLESILSHLSPRDLLLSQRVSRTWASLIASSPPLQRRLFFLPDWSNCVPSSSFPTPPPTITTTTTTTTTDTSPSSSTSTPPFHPTANPLLPRAFPCNYPTIATSPSASCPPPSSSTTTLTPASQQPPREPTIHAISLDLPATAPASCTPSSTTGAFRPAVLYERASWRRMLLCQPPCTRLRLVKARPRRVGREAVVWARGARPVEVRKMGVGGEVEEVEDVEARAGGEEGEKGEGAGQRHRGGEEVERRREGPEGLTMGMVVERVQKAEGEGWDREMVGGDGSWHFEGKWRVGGEGGGDGVGVELT